MSETERGEEVGKPDVRILYTPATLSEGHEAFKELERVAADARQGGGPKRLSKEMLDELRASGWLSQSEWRRGGFLSTFGLHDALDVPELILLNVPGPFAPCAHNLLNRMAEHILENHSRLQVGEVFVFDDPSFEMAVTVDLIEPGDLQVSDLGRPMMVVVPLP